MFCILELVSKQIPDEWVRSERATQFFGELASAPLGLLLLDYDGTLAPFTPDRLRAVPYPGVKGRLKRLLHLPRTRIFLVSGRRAQELNQLLDLDEPIEIWGSHGREHLETDGAYQVEQVTAYEKQALRTVSEGLALEFSPDTIELKPNSVAVHWRTTAGKHYGEAEIRSSMEKLFATLPPISPEDGILELLAFDGGLELRAGSINKGYAVRRILEQFPPTTPAAFLGDDMTDEDAFAELRERGLAVLVRAEPRETFARLWLSPPEDLAVFLDAWIAAVENPL